MVPIIGNIKYDNFSQQKEGEHLHWVRNFFETSVHVNNDCILIQEI